MFTTHIIQIAYQQVSKIYIVFNILEFLTNVFNKNLI